MDEHKAKKAFAAVKLDMQKINSKINKIESSITKSPQKDKEVDLILSTLQALKAETFENTKRIEALNTVINTTSSEKETSSYQKDIEELKLKIKELQVKAPQVIQEKSMPLNEQKIENTFNEFSEIMNEKMQIEMNSLRLEFTEEIAKLYDKCFNEILNLKGELEKQKSTSSPRSPKAKTKPQRKKEESAKKESKLKKISKFLFVDEDEDDLKSIKNQVEDKNNK